MQKNHLKLYLTGIILFISLSNISFANEQIFQAMRDEMHRTIEKLKLEGLEKPYFVEYTLTVRKNYNVHTSLGSVIDTTNQLVQYIDVGIRVGDYKFDNTDFFDFGLSFFGSSDDEETYKKRQVPLELDYNALRRELWLATDAAYKQSAEIYTKKQTMIKNRSQTDTTPDFIRMNPERYIDTNYTYSLNFNKYIDLCKSLSIIFKNYPTINASSVNFEFLPKRVYYINSEGREYAKDEFYSGLEVVASTQCDDGMPIANYYTALSQMPENIPGKDSLIKAVTNVAEKLAELKNAPILDQPYSGPVLFEDVAAAEVFAQSFAPNLVTQRQPLTEQGQQESDRYTAFQTKIGGRVLPEFLSIDALPNSDHQGTIPLIGFYKVDDEGVQPESVSLVKNGYLKNLLSSRVPTRRVKQSNGHKRGGASMISNLIINTDADHSKPNDSLVAKMMKLVKDRELPYGIIVTKVFNQNIMYTTLLQQTVGTFHLARNNKLSIVEAYKVFPDGKMELVRGTECSGLTVQSFKDIINVGDNQYVLNLLAPSVTSPYISGGDQYIGASVIVPNLLFEDAEIKPLETDFPKPPILINPLTIK